MSEGLMSGGSDSKIDLVWSNSSPAVNFATRTLSLNLKKYSKVLILAKYVKTAVDTKYLIGDYFTIGESGRLGNDNRYVSTLDVYRTVTVSTDSIALTTTEYSDEYIIPLQIYGIK